MVKQSIKNLHRRRSPALMLKLDVAKAFDSVAWPFLLEVLRHRGFGPRWIARVAMMLSTLSTKVLVNGLAEEKFWHARGLRQGDLRQRRIGAQEGRRGKRIDGADR